MTAPSIDSKVTVQCDESAVVPELAELDEDDVDCVLLVLESSSLESVHDGKKHTIPNIIIKITTAFTIVLIRNPPAISF